MRRTVNGILGVVGAVLISVAFAAPALAQGTSAPASTPAGIGVLIFLLGLGAIGFIGFSYLAQSRAGREDAKEFEDVEDE